MAKNFNDLSPTVQAAVLISVAVAVSAGVFWYFVLPLSAQRDNLEKQVKKLHAENLKNKAFEQERTEYLNRIAQLEKQLETLRSIVPDEQAADEFVRVVYDAATRSGIFIRTFIAQPLVPHDFYTEMPFKVRLDGTYYGLMSFFNRLAHEQRIVNVLNLALGPPQGGGMGAFKVNPSETVGANCEITTYFNSPQAQQATMAAAAKKKRR
jgi:type IV pilus assembly protein PilO